MLYKGSMRNIFVIGLVILMQTGLFAQELNCEVKLNYDRITNVNTQIFKTLETSLGEFINRTKWTNLNFNQREKIDCSFFINISEFNNNQFTATIQVAASRPVLNSTYSTPILNTNDRDFSFRYVEFENLFFNPNSFDSNLISVVAFYVYMIIGIDADTFTLNGGTEYYETAQNIVAVAQSGGFRGWNQSDGLQNRFFMVNDMLSNTFSAVRESLYQYHTNGMDKMADDLKSAKENIKMSLATLSKVHSVRPNAYLTRIFFDTKSDEIVSIFSGGPSIQITDLLENLNRISPLNASKWVAIKM